ncbi:MAG: hypothetical protein QOH25_3109 [Acidobacteriota bacterium]|jgi:hypothetical protein|nr:hypothetical protein [Acidobacteriota bacterium]
MRNGKSLAVERRLNASIILFEYGAAMLSYREFFKIL